jgi:glycine cleavage system aminomethyltransferase T
MTGKIFYVALSALLLALCRPAEAQQPGKVPKEAQRQNSTGLTFGTMSALYGLQVGYITSAQFSVLVAVVIATAVIPTFVAQRWFSPALPEQVQEEVLAQEEESI